MSETRCSIAHLQHDLLLHEHILGTHAAAQQGPAPASKYTDPLLFPLIERNT